MLRSAITPRSAAAIGSWAPLAASEAIPDLFALFRETDPDTWLFDRLCLHLPTMGAIIVEAALAEVESTVDDDRYFALGDILAECRTRDERIFRLLLGQLEEEPGRAASNLGISGDRRALPLLSQALDRFELRKDRPIANHAVVELRSAIEDLGGTLSPGQVAKYLRGRDLTRAAIGGPTRGASRPGRNQPCWCGSGKKYKRCHLEADARGDRDDQ